MLFSLFLIVIKRDEFLWHRRSVESPNETYWAVIGAQIIWKNKNH